MRLKSDQLDAALKKNLAPLYLISGDEPLQQGEAADAIRLAAQKAGYANREILTADANFHWSALTTAADNYTIFSDKKIIDLRLPSGKPGADGAKALSEYCTRRPEDTLLLITTGKLDSASTKAKWFQTLDQTGVIVQVWPLTGTDLLDWLQKRMAGKGLSCDREGLRILANRIEGNLLAAAQEIEKLYILYGPASLSRDDILSVVADSSRYDVFNLCDVMLDGRIGRTLKILQGLQSEAVPAPIVLWAITREIRLLISIKEAQHRGASKEQAVRSAQIWDNRKNSVLAAEKRLTLTQLDEALRMSAEADRRIKGASPGDEWEQLLAICLQLAGADIMAKTA